MLFKKWVEKAVWSLLRWDVCLKGGCYSFWGWGLIVQWYCSANTSSPHFILSGCVPAFLCPKLTEEKPDALPTLSATQVVPVTIITGCELKLLELGVDAIPSPQDPTFSLYVPILNCMISYDRCPSFRCYQVSPLTFLNGLREKWNAFPSHFLRVKLHLFLYNREKASGCYSAHTVKVVFCLRLK